MAGSRFRPTAVALALLGVLAAAAYFTGGFTSNGGPLPRPSDRSSTPQTGQIVPSAGSTSASGPTDTLQDAAVTGAPAGSREASAAQPASTVGFASRRKLEQHYQKHGAEFGAIAMDEYLQRAQTLRDRTAGGGVLECVRADGVITRYDRASGAFLAFDANRTIRTFFRPNDGEAYFHRQCRRGAP
jgi:hypothetical protein